MTRLWRLPPEEARKALVLGALMVRARRQRTAPAGQPHPIPDLTGHPPQVVARAVLAAVLDAHSGDDDVPPCPRCHALYALGSRYGDASRKAWPNPVTAAMIKLLDAAIQAQDRAAAGV